MESYFFNVCIAYALGAFAFVAIVIFDRMNGISKSKKIKNKQEVDQ